MFSSILAAHVCTVSILYIYCNHSFQDPEGGGIADRPGDMVDVFHTHFGIAGEWGHSLYNSLVRPSDTVCKDFLFWDILV